ncbi:MAG: hypothetical protein RJB66_2630 [Pseudomonadota bacterium]|jgi:hypothetical protein
MWLPSFYGIIKRLTVTLRVGPEVILGVMLLSLVACQPQKKEEANNSTQNSLSPIENDDGTIDAPVGTKDCALNGSNSSVCVLSKDSYFYKQENGGRNPEVKGPLVFKERTIQSLPDGWVAAMTSASFTDPNLKASNIRRGITIFGVTGTVNSDHPLPCNLATMPFSEASCLLSSGLFAYTSEYGGRANVCSITNGSQPENCWLNNSNTYFLSNQLVTLINRCSANDVDSSIPLAGQCWTPAGPFVYTQAYGGRSTLCKTDESANATACWAESLNETNKGIIASSNTQSWCNWNEKTTSTCKVRINVTINPGDSQTPASLPYGYVYPLQYGGRSKYCSKNSDGKCWLAVEKSQLESNLKPEIIKAGVAIFGVVGKFKGEGAWKSGAHRDLVTSPLAISDESFVYGGDRDKDTGFPDGYREVPMSELDDEGTYSNSVLPVDRTGWGSLTCGTGLDAQGNPAPLPAGFDSWSFRARMADCGDVFGTAAVWNGTTNGNAGQSKWKLVIRTGDLRSGKGREVWLDENTGLLWSSLISTATNWCKASGSNNIAGNSALENDPNDICDSAAYQNLAGNAVSACFEGDGFSTTDSTLSNDGKANLLKSSTTLPVAWRLPTIYDFDVGEYNGMRFVLPDMGVALKGIPGTFYEWTATVSSSNSREAWVVPSLLGGHGKIDRSMTARVRCIGRANILE